MVIADRRCRPADLAGAGERAEPLPAALTLTPGHVHMRVRHNCRMAPGLLVAISGRLGRPLDHAGDRMPDSSPGALEVVPVAERRELPAPLTALKARPVYFGPNEVVVLSPFSEQSSLEGRSLARRPAWRIGNFASRCQVIARSRGAPSSRARGLDGAAVVLTEITPDASARADEPSLS
jgi:hypothetical protein